MAGRDPEKPPKGPWSDLPPPAPVKREGWLKWPKRGDGRKAAREPLIRNWRALLIVLFLLLVAPLLASWVSHFILGLVNRGS